MSLLDVMGKLFELGPSNLYYLDFYKESKQVSFGRKSIKYSFELDGKQYKDLKEVLHKLGIEYEEY